MTKDAKDCVFRDVRALDSRQGTLGRPVNVTVSQGFISSIVPLGEAPEPATDALIVEGGGRTLMPGLIDVHWHAAMASIPMTAALGGDPGYIQILAGVQASETLQRGFTTVRDAGGPVFGLKQAIDQGAIPGPRIFPSGAMISQTGGHGDFRTRNEVPRGRLGHLSHVELLGGVCVADGVDEVLRGAREQLMLGATQLKVMAGGGVASSYDPLDVTQYTEAELRATVEAAENWGTYVMVHAYTPAAVTRAIRAGVRCIEHGQLLDDATVALMAEEGVWWSLQPFLDDEDAIPMTGANRAKQLQMIEGTDVAYALARKHGVRLAWGTDTLFDPGLAAKQGKQLAKLTRWFSPAEVITLATAANAELVELCGPRNPYPGKLGVVEVGAHADLLLVDGNPLDDITLLARPDTSLLVVMKAGSLVKNVLTI